MSTKSKKSSLKKNRVLAVTHKSQDLRKTTALKRMINSKKLDFLMEAHSGLSAKIVEEAGFNGIWASGLSISASLGVRDNNEASWTQVLDVLEYMSDATRIPILLDGDTGYGNFNNMRRLVRKLEQRGVAGVCIEDKLFPKTNSFIDGERQPLADIEEFCGKIRAGKDEQSDDDFCIIARVEAFIAGWGVDEAIKRAEAYRKAGADAILIHSKKADFSDIEAFVSVWDNRHPVVIVPTKYYSTPTQIFRQKNISMVIWANHLLRSSVSSMQQTAAKIKDEQSLLHVEDTVVSVAEIFRLQGEDALQELEKKYLPKSGKDISAIILAASRGDGLEEVTADKPKAMVDIGGQPVLFRLVHELNEVGVKRVNVVRGYKKEAIKGANISAIDNDDYINTKDLYSLYLAQEQISGDCLIAYGDTLFRRHLLTDSLTAKGDVVIVVDADSKKSECADMVICNKPYTNDFLNKNITLKRISSRGDIKKPHGEWTGIICANEKGSRLIRTVLKSIVRRGDFKKLTLVDLLSEVLKKTKVEVVYTKGCWIDIDSAKDLIQAGRFFL